MGIGRWEITHEKGTFMEMELKKKKKQDNKWEKKNNMKQSEYVKQVGYKINLSATQLMKIL